MGLDPLNHFRQRDRSTFHILERRPTWAVQVKILALGERIMQRLQLSFEFTVTLFSGVCWRRGLELGSPPFVSID